VISPKAAIRRFDVFAEYTRLEKRQEGMQAAISKGYAIWLAKVVAARKFGRIRPGMRKHAEVRAEAPEERGERKFRSLGGVEQTDQVFDKDIIKRMGRDFYRKVFAPAIKDAFERGKAYREIRDTIRKSWKP
jgi:hypothetical protein